MRALLWLAVCGFLVAGRSARADTISESVQFSGAVANGPEYITGNLFNPSLGTLTGVSIGEQGTFNADLVIAGAPFQLGGTLASAFEAAGQPASGTFYSFIATDHTGTYTGIEGFGTLVNLPSFENYVQGSPSATPYLAAVQLTDFINSLAYNVSSDLSTYSGTLDVTYTYDVPEPASWPVMGVALGVLLLASRHRMKRDRSCSLHDGQAVRQFTTM